MWSWQSAISSIVNFATSLAERTKQSSEQAYRYAVENAQKIITSENELNALKKKTLKLSNAIGQMIKKRVIVENSPIVERQKQAEQVFLQLVLTEKALRRKQDRSETKFPMQKGSRGTLVVVLQDFLISKGLLQPFENDGIWGEKTEAALRRGKYPTVFKTPQELNSLVQLSGKSASSGERNSELEGIPVLVWYAGIAAFALVGSLVSLANWKNAVVQNERDIMQNEMQRKIYEDARAEGESPLQAALAAAQGAVQFRNVEKENASISTWLIAAGALGAAILIFRSNND